MADYSAINVLQMLERRRLGLPIKEKGRHVRNCRNNYRSDFELLKTLLCDRQLYLEVIACRKVNKAAEPSFCHNRLFTNNYHSWFDLCTSPTAGPSLMKSNIFSEMVETTARSNSLDGPKVVDAVTVNPPNGCKPLPNSQHLPCILLLCKNGWLYQFSLEDANLLNKIYIPTNVFSDNLYESSDYLKHQHNWASENTSAKQIVSSLTFRYKYITINGAEGKVLVRSSNVVQNGIAYVAYALLTLFPLGVESHFVTKAKNSNLKAELWTDIFVLTAVRGSSVTLYGFKDIESLYRIDSFHIHIGKKVFSPHYCNYGEILQTEVGDADIGIPYTTEPIDLEKIAQWSRFELFHTKALKHIFRVGGVPYHYLVPIDNSCTSWSLRNLLDKKEVAKFHVDEKWDQSHISGVDFHSDESGRLLLINKNSVNVYKIGEKSNIRRQTTLVDDFKRSHSGSTTNCKHPSTKKHAASRLITTSTIAEPDFQLRVIGSPCNRLVPNAVIKQQSLKYKPFKCFEIDVNCNDAVYRPPSDESKSENWIYPSQMSNVETGRSSYGRTLRHTRMYASHNSDGLENGIQGISYEDELDVLAVLHFNYQTDRSYGSWGRHYDLVVSLYDNATGARLNTVTIEQDLVPSDGCETSIILDEDTIIYTRSEMNNMLNYKIMRFCRKY